MNESSKKKPVIALLSDPDEHPWPGLEAIERDAKIERVTGTEELEAVIGEADILLVTDFRSNAVERAFPKAEKLQWIHATSAGVDPLMFEELIESDIPLTNARGIFDRGIAESVLGYILAFAKDLPTTFALQQKHEWRHRDSETIKDKSVLIIGAGSIGREIGRLLMNAGMKAAGMASARRDDPVFGTVYGNDELAGQLPAHDFIVLATPLTEQTHHLIDRDAFTAMKPSARLINIGRGAVVDTKALIAALKDNEIAGAALDVFEEEPLPDDHPLWDFDNVIISHHMAGDVIGWREMLSQQFIENLYRWREGAALSNQVRKRKKK